MNAREFAFKVLMDIEKNRSYADIALKRYLNKTPLDPRDRALATELVYGVVERRNTLDYVIASLSSKKSKPDIRALNVLRMGLYQVMYLDKIPPSAACDQAVELAKKHCGIGISKFVNAIIRSYLRNGVEFPEESRQPVKYLALKYSHPEWMVERLLKDYDYQFVRDFLDANNRKAETCVRVNTLKISAEDLMLVLEDEGFETKRGKYAAEAVYVQGVKGIEKLNSYKDGLFHVQGESSMLVSHMLDPQPGEFIVDVCGAPGGKATHIVQLMDNKGTVVARDIYQHRVDLIHRNCKRLGVTIVKPQLYDAKVLDKDMVDKADRVLVDAPCTGYGVIRKKPDIKWYRNPEDESELVNVQRRILYNASRYLKKGGLLVYSTCTVTRRENEEQVKGFLLENQDFEWESSLSLYPHVHGLDGFFISCLRRK